MRYNNFMKKLLLSFAIVLLFLPQAYASEWSFKDLDALNGGCLGTASENLDTLGKAFEYCGCTTSHISQSFTVEEFIDFYESDPNFMTKGEVKRIVNYCNGVIR